MSNLLTQMHTALNKEYIKRLLTQYFTQKGYNENFDKKIYPPNIQDLPQQIPQLQNKIEIIPHVTDIDPQTGIVKIGWNLFLLGTKRIYLGESTHTNLAEIKNNIMGPLNNQTGTTHTTPKKIIEFITKTLTNSKNGNITDTPLTLPKQQLNLGTGDQSGYYRHSQRPVF